MIPLLAFGRAVNNFEIMLEAKIYKILFNRKQNFKFSWWFVKSLDGCTGYNKLLCYIRIIDGDYFINPVIYMCFTWFVPPNCRILVTWTMQTLSWSCVMLCLEFQHFQQHLKAALVSFGMQLKPVTCTWNLVSEAIHACTVWLLILFHIQPLSLCLSLSLKPTHSFTCVWKSPESAGQDRRGAPDSSVDSEDCPPVGVLNARQKRTTVKQKKSTSVDIMQHDLHWLFFTALKSHWPLSITKCVFREFPKNISPQ